MTAPAPAPDVKNKRGNRAGFMAANRRRLSSYLLCKEIVMTSMRINASISPTALAIIACVLSTGVALASQGPGSGMGTASHFTQVAMAILVYGTSTIVVAAGLVGAARGRRRFARDA
jgi:cation transporter-like permease